MAACLFLTASCTTNYSRFSTLVEKSESSHFYKFKSKFDKKLNADISDHINQSLAPVRLFKSVEDNYDQDIILSDNTHFHMKASSGIVEVELIKGDNSKASYNRIKKMCEGIAEIIGKPKPA